MVRHLSEESRAKIGFRNRGRVVSDKTREAIAKSKSKPVVRLNDGEVFPSILAAARASGLSFTSVSSICRGKADSIRGMRFKFYNGDLKTNEDEKD